MSDETTQAKTRTWPMMAGQGTFSVMGWSMASPSIVVAFLALSMGLPVFLTGILVSVRHAANTVSDVFLSRVIAKMPRKKSTLAIIDIAIAGCFLALVLVTVFAGKSVMIAAFVIAIFAIGVLQEMKTLMIVDFISDVLPSKERMRLSYMQKAIGGAATIAVVLLLHQLLKEAPAEIRHGMVIGFGAICFIGSALFLLAVPENSENAEQKAQDAARPEETAGSFWGNLRMLGSETWFRKFIVIRLTFVVVGLSVPFYALIAAEAHHSSTRGLTLLIVSSAAALMVAAPLWRSLSALSNRSVMLTSAGMILVTGIGLITLHFTGLDHGDHFHALTIFVVTVAVTGLGSARGLYFMNVAPKSQRVTAQALAATLSRVVIILLSAMLAALAHANEPILAIVAITIGSLVAIVAILALVEPQGQKSGEDGTAVDN